MTESAVTATVLIADDDRVTLRVLSLLLDRKGYRLECVETGAEALQRARDLKPDLLLLDVNMPDMDGFEVCKALRADPTLAELPIMMLTALTDRDARLRGIEAGADDFITKPFDKVELAARVRTVLRLNRYRRVQEAQRLERQLEMASAVQQLLLPRETPIVAGLEVTARYRPAAHVGGDLYDFILQDGRLYFVAADVSGHGVAAAIFMSSARSAIRTLLDSTGDIIRIAERLNTRIFDDSGESGMFVSAVIGRYDPTSRQLELVNCGHPEPLIVRRDGSIEAVDATAAPIGILEPLGATPFLTTLAPGELLCLCTDGLLESCNATGEQFGMSRLQAALAASVTAGLDAVAGAITEAVETFHGSRDLEDDFTLVLLRGLPMGADTVMTVACRLDELAGVAGAASRLAEPILGGAAAALIDMAVTEVCSNVVRHGHPNDPHHHYTVRITPLEASVEIEVRDAGPEFEFIHMMMPPVEVRLEDMPEGGFGMALVATTMDEFEQRRENGVNITRIVKRRA